MKNFTISDFHFSSKIWVYTLNPVLDANTESLLNSELELFCQNWTAHNRELRAFYKIFENRFLVLGVDEHLNPASGCSIDKSVHFLEDVEKKFSISVFDRMLFSYIDDHDNCITLNRSEFEKAISEGTISGTTNVVNTLTNTLADWNDKSIIKLQDSWMNNFFSVSELK